MNSKRGLSVGGLHRRFGARTVLHDLSLNVVPGEVVGLLGPNGAGKTTAFRIIAGLLAPHGGSVELNGVVIDGKPLWKRARAGLGYLPQRSTIIRRLSVRQNIELATGNDGGVDCDELLRAFGLEHLADQPGASLSGGERRRVEIVRAFGAQPEILLVDEPFAGLDPMAIAGVTSTLRELANDGVGVLLSDHDVRQTLEVCDRIYILFEGKLLCEGPPGEVAKNPAARARYFGQAFSVGSRFFQAPEPPSEVVELDLGL